MFAETVATILLDEPLPPPTDANDDDYPVVAPMLPIGEAIRKAIAYAEIAGWGFRGDGVSLLEG
jgi:hypothetical protein